MVYYSPVKAAELIGVCKATVLRSIKAGSLKASKLGAHTIRISEADLNEYYQSKKTVERS